MDIQIYFTVNMRHNAIAEKLVVTGFKAGLQFTKGTSLNKPL